MSYRSISLGMDCRTERLPVHAPYIACGSEKFCTITALLFAFTAFIRRNIDFCCLAIHLPALLQQLLVIALL